MKACWCTLYITNPDACEKCPENTAVGYVQVSESAHNQLVQPLQDWQELLDGWRIRKTIEPKEIWTIKTKKITEKYDENGNLIEKIIEEGTN